MQLRVLCQVGQQLQIEIWCFFAALIRILRCSSAGTHLKVAAAVQLQEVQGVAIQRKLSGKYNL